MKYSSRPPTQRELAAKAGVEQRIISEAMALLRTNRDLLIAVIGGMPMSEAQHEAEQMRAAARRREAQGIPPG